jgi:hypothetical protein
MPAYPIIDEEYYEVPRTRGDGGGGLRAGAAGPGSAGEGVAADGPVPFAGRPEGCRRL